METPGGPIAFCILTTNNKDQRWTDDNEGDLLCAELGSAIYQYFNSTGQAPVAPVARTLQSGASGDLVEALQRTLNARIKDSPGIGVDGDFGPETEGAVKKFQTQEGLESTGIVSADTWRALGPLLTDEEPTPEPAVVNAETLEKEPADKLDGTPFVTAKAWAIIDGRSGEFLAGEHDQEKRAPASTTKIMTAFIVTRLAAEDPKVLEEIVTFSSRADNTTGSTSSVREGEKLTVGELLYGLMLPSGNDASVALAEHFGVRYGETLGGADHDKTDPYDHFIQQMNDVAKSLGLQSTHFDNPHGLTSDDHKTTARDLASLAHHALRIPLFQKNRLHAAAWHDRGLGVRLQAQCRMAQHESIAENRRLRRHQNRHHRGGRKLPRIHRRTRRPPFDRRRPRLHIHGLTLHRHAQPVPLGVGGPCKDR